MYIIRLFTILGLISSWATTIARERPSSDELNAAFSAKVLASAVFVSGRQVHEALENSVYAFVGEGGLEPEDLTSIVVDRERGTVSVTMNDKVTRTAKFFGDQGCVILPKGADKVWTEDRWDRS